MDRLEEGRARRLARYWSGEAETKGWACIACYAGAGLASGFVLPVAGLLYVLERWREFNSHEGDKEAALAMAAKEAESAEKQKKEEAPQAAKKAKQTGGREAARTGRARKPGDAFLAAPRPPSQLRKRRPKPGAFLQLRLEDATEFKWLAPRSPHLFRAVLTELQWWLLFRRGELYALCLELSGVSTVQRRHAPTTGMDGLLWHSRRLGGYLCELARFGPRSELCAV